MFSRTTCASVRHTPSILRPNGSHFIACSAHFPASWHAGCADGEAGSGGPPHASQYGRITFSANQHLDSCRETTSLPRPSSTEESSPTGGSSYPWGAPSSTSDSESLWDHCKGQTRGQELEAGEENQDGGVSISPHCHCSAEGSSLSPPSNAASSQTTPPPLRVRGRA